MNSPIINQLDLPEFLAEFKAYGAQRLSPEQLAPLLLLAEKFFLHYPLEELAGRKLSDLFGSLYQSWQFLQTYDDDQPKIKLFNPNLAEDGWVCPHTALIVLQRDMPFLVDSIRIELNRRNITIHAIKSTLLQIQRNQQHEFVAFVAAAGEPLIAEGNNSKEALIFLEISMHTANKDLIDIAESLESVLQEVSLVVGDYAAMKASAFDAAQNLPASKESIAAINVEETREFLHWLAADHFTFLGVAEYEFFQDGDKKYLRECPAARRGVFAARNQPGDELALEDFNEGMARFHLVPQIISFSKSAIRARVHRYAYADYVVVKRFNEVGEVCGELRFLGLYTSNVYWLSPQSIPLIRTKIAKVIARTELNDASHDGKNFRQILETFPRNEIFLSSSSELYDTLMGVAKIKERAMVRLFMRADPYGKFVSFVIYVPRDYFSTRVRLAIQALIGSAIGSDESEFTTYFSESILARVYLVFKLNEPLTKPIDVESLQAGIVNITRSWNDYLQAALLETHGEEQSADLLREYRQAFSLNYQENFDARTAVADMQRIAELNEQQHIALNLYQPITAQQHYLQFKIFHRATTLALSDVIPVLENLGFRVVSESAYEITPLGKMATWLHDFKLEHRLAHNIDLHLIKDSFMEAFSAIWYGHANSDAFNGLVSSLGMTWRQVRLLRAYAGYMHQTLFPFSEVYIANTLVNQNELALMLINYFEIKFDPDRQCVDTQQDLEALKNRIVLQLDKVSNLNEDRIIRRYLTLLENTLRTNFFQKDKGGSCKQYLSLKFSPRNMAEIPEPRPLFEIFVFSARVEGVHLRTSKVARGGLRWSDRLQDYRTEVLGLVKAQQVKNAVIVPSGAKGGFVCKQAPQGGSRENLLAEAIACYKIFICGLLDLTDNLRDGKLIPPPQLVRYDQDDPYLVVAADKGTASFSDIANSISADYGHWLGDAFASGGSQGYDHKGMGITARGAWISVQRLFMEKGINVQTDAVSVIGIGDMAGDVFGNGVLLSETIRLVAAFNHQHIFIDPNPNSAASFEERKRLFVTPKTTWADYEKAFMSEGGGIFDRAAKSITISPQMAERFAIAEASLTPNELINALLKAPVDLIWNGGIGTYVKASTETHAEVGDKANDNLRVNGSELRAQVFGEGGNLGMTQRGRIEYCLNGGSCNTDFIDNAGGVDCSDHEVNIKILLNEVVANGDLTAKQRNQLLVDMTENVAQLVLHNNYRQVQAISVAQSESLLRSAEYRRFMSSLQTQGRLDRKLEFLPDDEALVERQLRGKGLTRPELSVLISYAKAVLKEDLAKAHLERDDYIAKFVESAFPVQIAQQFPEPLRAHRLRAEIVATQIANDMVNLMGISFAQRLSESTGASSGDIAKAYVVARNIYAADDFLTALATLDHQLPAALQLQLINNLMRKVRRATRWFLRNRRSQLNAALEVELFAEGMRYIEGNLASLLLGDALQAWQSKIDKLVKAGVPEALALAAATPVDLYSGLSVIEAARLTDKPLEGMAQLYFSLGEYLSLPWFAQQISDLTVENFWQAMARETHINDLESQLRSLSISLIGYVSETCSIVQVIERWSAKHQTLISRWNTMVNELQAGNGNDFAMFSVALRDLLDLAQASQHGTNLDAD